MPAADAPSIPVIRLFDQRDILFLRSAPGYNPHMETGFRRRRCEIFRAYLRGLRAEFLAARQLAPWFLRMRFACALIPAYLCLFRYRWELGGSHLEPLVQRLEAVRGEMRRLISEISEPRH